MKSKTLLFPLSLILASSAIAGTYTWTGATSSVWTAPANWELAGTMVSPDTYPNYGSTYTSDFLTIRNNGDLTNNPPGVTPGAGAVFNPGVGITTHFNLSTGRGLAIGIGVAPNLLLDPPYPGAKGRADLTITSGTLKFTRVTNSGSEPFMANRADSNLLINGGHLDLSTHVNNFRLIQEGFPGITSTITLSSGALSCRNLDLLFDQEATSSTVFGDGVINLDGGTFTVRSFIRSAAADPGQTTSKINLNGGTLRAFAAVASPGIFLPPLPDTQVIVKAGGAIIDTNTFANIISANLEHDSTLGASLDGGLTKNGHGNLTLNGTNTFTGGVTINAGTTLATPSRVILGASDAGAGTGTINLAGSYTELQLGLTRNIANPLVISNTGDEKTLLFVNAGASQYSGPITINETNADHFRVRSDSNCFLTFSGKISGAGGIFKFQQGWVTLSNATNDFTGGAKINQGVLNFSTGALGSTGAVTMDGGTLRWIPGGANNDDLSGRLVMVDGKSAIFSTGDGTNFVTFASAIGNNSTASLVKQGTGWLTLSLPSTYSGGTTVSVGTLSFSSGGLGTTGAVTMDGGTLRWAPGNTEDISSRLVMVDGKTAIFSTVETVALANPIGNATTANLEKSGGGTLSLSGTNTYTGTTTVLGGTLLVNGSLDAASAVTVTGGNLGGTGTIGGSVTVEAAGNIAPGTSAGQLNISGGLDVAAMAADTGKLKLELGGDTASSDRIAVGGTLTIGDGALGFGDFEFTNLGGLQIGTYTLITSSVIAVDNSLDATNLSGAIGSFNGTLAISGNNIVLNVTAGASGYSAWQLANSTSGTLGDDHDNDGVDNGTEYFLFGSTNSTGFTALPGVTNTGGALSVTWTKAATGYAGTYGSGFVVETSDTLVGDWATEVVSPNPGFTVTVTGNDVKYTFPAGTKKFARLKVTGP